MSLSTSHWQAKSSFSYNRNYILINMPFAINPFLTALRAFNNTLGKITQLMSNSKEKRAGILFISNLLCTELTYIFCILDNPGRA